LIDFFEIKAENFHRALSDAKSAAELFLHLVDLALLTDLKEVRKILEILEPTDEIIKIFFSNLYLFLAQGKYHFQKRLDKTSLIYSTNFYNIIGEDDSPENGHLKIEDIDSGEIAAFFDKDGLLEKSFGIFELREVQIEMAQEVAKVFNGRDFLVVEAGTGTGKSLAYLLPALKWSLQNYGPFGRVIVSTNTKNLQEQLFFKDLPILHSILKEKFKAVLLKGKGNYLCLDKWFSILKDMKYRLNTFERSRILPLYMWVKQTETGDISENNGFALQRNLSIWSKFIAEDNYCPGKSCKYYSQCYLWRARNNARNAHLVVTNHSLLFSDLAAENAILSDYSNVIFDEAHNIEKVATEYLGIQISLWHFREIFNKLHQRERIETGILVQLRRRIQLGDLEKHKKELFRSHIDSIITLLKAGWNATQGFFKELSIHLKELVPSKSDKDYNTRFRYQKMDTLEAKMSSYYSELSEYLRKIQGSIHELLELFKEIPSESFRYQKQISQELLAQFTQFEALQNNLQFLIAAEWDDWIYWFEINVKYDSDACRLYAAPLNISEILYEKLYKNLNTAVFTSATLTVGRSFDYLSKRVGLNYLEPERLNTLLLDSPFNYDEQVLFAVPAFIPDPRSPDYREVLKSFLGKLVIEQPRGTLVLFTSYSLLNEMYSSLKLTYESEKISLLAQGIDGGRHSIINEFRNNPRSVLFGTDSFWEGIDVPGEALEILLISKLPFDVPSDPIIQAKAELVEREGGNAFMDFTLPEAVIKFRQGFGRLVRSKSDFGVIIILDTRVIKKMYGRIFLESIPVKTTIFQDEDILWEKLLNWFKAAGKLV
jgi:predicted DnaQ family exonuclease/DinG family helicase